MKILSLIRNDLRILFYLLIVTIFNSCGDETLNNTAINLDTCRAVAHKDTSEIIETDSITDKLNIEIETCVLIKQKNYKITLLQGNYKFFNPPPTKPWTPTKNQILDFERKLINIISTYKNLKNIDSLIKNLYKENLYSSLDDVPTVLEETIYIIKNIDNYNRQYKCYLNKKNEKILDIQFYKRNNDDNLNVPDCKMIDIMGGGADYFNITYNLNQKKVLEFWINDPI